MSTASGEVAVRMAARTAVAALLLAMVLQFLALSDDDRVGVWLTGTLCAHPLPSARQASRSPAAGFMAIGVSVSSDGLRRRTPGISP